MRKDAFASAVAILLILSGGAAAEMRDAGTPDTKTPTIQVIGTGSVHAEPDTATIRIGVTTEDLSAQAAVSRNTAATAKVIAGLDAASIAKKDIKTSNFSVYPQYRTENDTKRQVLTYRVSNTVIVTIHDIAKVGDILTEVVAAGSNQINGPTFSVSNPDKFLTEARKKAVEDALAKAGAYASAAGLKLGRVIEMTEAGGSAPSYALRAHEFTRSAAAAVPIEAGQESLEAHIVLVIELKQ
ncbi:MAG: SIMPL domain-containing protein [Rhodomicrobium sp.]